MSSATNLIQAVKDGNAIEVERILFENDTLAAATDEQGVPATMIAIYYGYPEIARHLVAVRGEFTPFEAAALGETEALASAEPVDAYSSDGFTALGFASYFGHLECVRKLLERGANPNLRSQNAMGVAPLHSALAGSHLSVARLLLEKGADPAAQTAEGWVPLHYAADLGDAGITELLLEKGATPYVHNKDGHSPVDLAMDSGHEHIADLIRMAMHKKTVEGSGS